LDGDPVSGKALLVGLGGGAATLLLCGAPLWVSAATFLAALPSDSKPDLVACGARLDTASAAPAASASTGARVAGWDQQQVANARVIIETGRQMQVPVRGWVIAVATAIQESDLHNLANLGTRNDHDSLGLFQQRPSQGWGTPAQVQDPAYASRRFYQKLLAVPGWLSLPLTVAAQRVQRSAFPNAYAKHEANATNLVNQITGGAGNSAATATTTGQCAGRGEVTAGGWVQPVRAEVVSGFGPRDGRLHAGVDLGAARRTPIRSAAAGTVIKAVCDAGTARSVGSCDVDGSSSARGCGWYVDIAHPDGVITRYCHLAARPLVVAGEQVTAGQQIGLVGSSGHSSGPHLHFEVHLHGDGHASGAVDPVPFMREHGAVLGG
jgi:murein DD-endopeptidase MepM/ murein hydrolase activator NlpD